MKLRYLFSMILTSALLFWGCEEVSTDSFDNIKLSKTYLSIPVEGGTAELTIDATEAWEFQTLSNWPEVALVDEEGNPLKDEDGKVKTEPSWLSVDIMEGTPGSTKVTFTAEAYDGGRELELSIKAGNNTQYLRVRQGKMDAVEATAADVKKAPDGKSFVIKGKCVEIAEKTYGNWYLEDETGRILIYGTLDANGDTKNFGSLNIEVGDIVKIEGPKSSYKGDPQMVNVTVLEHIKSMLTLPQPEVPVTEAGGEIEVEVAYKGTGVFVNMPAETREWITFLGMEYEKVEPSKLDPNPADIAHVKFLVSPNSGEPRDGIIEFTSHGDKNSTTEVCTIKQASPAAEELPYEESFADDLGRFTINDVLLSEGLTNVWKHDSYKYAKATAYINPVNYASESWLVSPMINLESVTEATLTFEHVTRYFGDKNQDATLWARTQGGEWKQLAIPAYSSGENWDFVSSGEIDLSEFAGGNMQFAFKYQSAAKAGTWEIRNVKVE